MKIKYIIKNSIWMFAVILGLSACSSKDDIPTRNEGPLSIVFSVDSEITKAVGDEITPSEAEVNVKCYHVAIFQNGQRVAHKEREVAEQAETYSTTFEDIAPASVVVYVIANYSTNWDDGTWDTYEKYRNKTITTNLNEVDELVKVGSGEFTVDEMKTGVLNLSLVQLTAGINVEIAFSNSEDIEHRDDPTYIWGENTQGGALMSDEAKIKTAITDLAEIATSALQKEYNGYWYSSWNSSQVKNNGTWKRDSWFGSKGVSPQNGALYLCIYDYNIYDFVYFRITAYERSGTCAIYVPVSGFRAGETTIAGRNKASYIFEENGKTIYKKDELYTASYIKGTYSFRFYTYEMGNNAMNLEVKIGEGTKYNVYEKSIAQYGYKIEKLQNSRWVEYKSIVWLGDGGVTLNPEDKPAKTVDALPGGNNELKNVKTYGLTIQGNTIKKGYLYKVKGTHTTIVKPILEWEVVGMEKVEVNPDPFE